MLEQLRGRLKPYFDRAGKTIARTGISPNAFTALAIPFALLAAYFVVLRQFHLALLAALIASAIDALDGAVARAQKKETPFGNYFDAVVDKIVEVFLLAGFVFQFPLLAFLALGGTLVNSYAKPRAGLVAMLDNRDWPGIGDRADRLTVLLLGLFVAGFLPTLQALQVISVMLVILILITWIGLAQRIQYAKKVIEEAQAKKRLLPYLHKKK